MGRAAKKIFKVCEASRVMRMWQTYNTYSKWNVAESKALSNAITHLSFIRFIRGKRVQGNLLLAAIPLGKHCKSLCFREELKILWHLLWKQKQEVIKLFIWRKIITILKTLFVLVDDWDGCCVYVKGGTFTPLLTSFLFFFHEGTRYIHILIHHKDVKYKYFSYQLQQMNNKHVNLPFTECFALQVDFSSTNMDCSCHRSLPCPTAWESSSCTWTSSQPACKPDWSCSETCKGRKQKKDSSNEMQSKTVELRSFQGTRYSSRK